MNSERNPNQGLARDAIERRLHALLKEQLGAFDHELRDTTCFVTDLGADSLDSLEILMATEDEFGIEISDEDAEELSTIGQTLDYLVRRLT